MASIYDWNMRKLIRRYLPVKLRWPENVAWGFALNKYLVQIMALFQGVKQSIAAEYAFNGLVHSLERLLNNTYDTTLRRIYISVPDQLPVLYFQDPEEPPVVYLQDEGVETGYFFLDVEEINAAGQYRYEFLVNIPATLSIDPDGVFAILETYRYAGRRPAVRFFDASNNTVNISYLPGA